MERIHTLARTFTGKYCNLCSTWYWLNGITHPFFDKRCLQIAIKNGMCECLMLNDWAVFAAASFAPSLPDATRFGQQLRCRHFLHPQPCRGTGFREIFSRYDQWHPALSRPNEKYSTVSCKFVRTQSPTEHIQCCSWDWQSYKCEARCYRSALCASIARKSILNPTAAKQKLHGRRRNVVKFRQALRQACGISPHAQWRWHLNYRLLEFSWSSIQSPNQFKPECF